MSEFSTVLSRFVKEKDVNVYRLAKYCGYDRANLYKVMRGERKPPSLEVLNLLCEYMHLSPAEEEILEENYEITMVGHDNYYRRKNVMKFFSDFSMTSNLENVLPTVEIKEDFEIPNSSYMLLRGNYEINSALFHIIADETKNQKGHIQILAQPEHALGNLLAMRGNTSNEIFTLFSDNLSLIFMSNLLRSLLLSIKCCINPHIVLQNFSMRNLSASPALQSYSSRVFYRNKSALHTAQYASSHAHYNCRN